MSKPPATRGTTPTEEEPHSIEDAIENILRDRVKGSQVRELTERLTQVVVSEQFYGPLPHPRHLQQYEATIPNGAERIMRMAEKNLDHTMALQINAQKAEISDGRWGLILGWSIFAFLILAALVTHLATGSEIVPPAFVGAAVIGGVGLFLKRGSNGSGRN